MNIRLGSLKEPLMKLHFPLILYAGLCSTFILYISLGRHTGATLWYFFQLLSPFFIIATAWLFSRQNLWSIICIPFLMYNLFSLTADTNYKWFTKKSTGWHDVSRLISEHEHILNISLIAPLLIEQNKEVIDNGMAEYFLPGGKRTSWMKYIFQEDHQALIQQIMYFDKIKGMIEDKEFDLIILQPTLLPLGVGNEIRKYYKYDGMFLIYAPQDRRPYTVTVWRPL